MKLPEGVPDTLDVSHVHEEAPSAFPNGTHVCEVEVDPDTGIVDVVKYTMVGDFGTVINPMLVEGQSHGGVVQGIGQAMFEHVVYSEDGQPLTGSFTDYALPRADDVPYLRDGLPLGAGEDQRAGRQGLRRGRLRGLAAVGDERHRRRAGRQAHQHAGHAGAGVGSAARLIAELDPPLRRVAGERKGPIAPAMGR